MSNIIFVSGIGTNIGKSYATGWLANKLISEGHKVTTLKMIQTGNQEYSEDIDLHRKIMNIPYTNEDKEHITAPIIMTYPSSPHLAARIDNVKIDLSKIDKSVEVLEKKYDIILMEGAGGLMVPITEDYLTLDYIDEHKLPVCLVTNGFLGSINHTLLSLLALKDRNIEVKYLIYNMYFDEDKVVAKETLEYMQRYMAKYFPNTEVLVMDTINLDK